MKYINYSKIEPIDGNCGFIKESFTDGVGFSRAEMKKGLSTTHYHKKMVEYYLVVEGEGIMRIQRNGKTNEFDLRPGVIVQIEPGEIHQTRTPEKLIVEVITFPAWRENDELITNRNLFE